MVFGIVLIHLYQSKIMKKLLSVLSFIFLGIGSLIAQTNVDEPFKPGKEMLSVGPFSDTLELKTGDVFYSQGRQHGSVGISYEFELKNDSVLELQQKHFAYTNPQIEGTTGGDNATVTYVFKALKKGQTQVIFRSMYRGKVENEQTLTVTVK